MRASLLIDDDGRAVVHRLRWITYQLGTGGDALDQPQIADTLPRAERPRARMATIYDEYDALTIALDDRRRRHQYPVRRRGRARAGRASIGSGLQERHPHTHVGQDTR